MTRKLKRHRDFEIELTIKNDAFIRPPHEGQRNWLLNRTLRELSDDLVATDELARRFVPGSTRNLPPDMASAELDELQIMEDWQRPLMEAMAEIVSGPERDVLEIGFGRGISAAMIQAQGVRSHTVVECNRSIADRFEDWKKTHARGPVDLVFGTWQEVVDSLGQYDAVFFHTYALNEEESIEYLGASTTFAEHFFPTAAAKLREGGVFTYLTNEIDTLSRSHQRSLYRFFRSIRTQRVALTLPDDVQDAWWADSMIVIEATK
jgi:guanidinoacetate N-methyltransferase